MKTCFDIRNPTPSIFSAGVRYICSPDNALSALNADGKLLWQYPTKHGFRAQAAVSPDGTAYIIGRYGQIHAVSAQGKCKWIYSSKWPMLKPNPFSIDSQGNLYAGTGRVLWVLSAAGEEKWYYVVKSKKKTQSLINSPTQGAGKNAVEDYGKIIADSRHVLCAISRRNPAVCASTSSGWNETLRTSSPLRH